jgi:hypothetical protein
MPTGVSGLIYPDQPKPTCELELDNSYYLIRLTDAQAFFPAGPFSQASSLLFSSSVESSFMPGTPTQSLYRLTTLKKNIPDRLGIHVDLTDWLPARSTDRIKVTLKYTVTRGAPIQALVDKVKQLDLATKVSVFGPGPAVALKVTEIVGHILSSFLQEGEQTDVFPSLILDLNLADLKAGYYAVIGSVTDEIWPRMLEIKENGPLTERGGRALVRHSYAVIQVLVIKRRGAEVLRTETWGELLQICKDKALDSTYDTEAERSRSLQEWRANLRLVRALAGKDRSVLQSEIDQVIATAHLAVEQQLLPQTIHEAAELDTYPDEWQEVLGFSTPQELQYAVQDYQDALVLSRRLIQEYNLSGM